MYPIRPVAKHYAWGSHTRLQRLFGLDAHGGQGNVEPLAEMWFSGHNQWPSLIDGVGGYAADGVGGATMPLTQAIRMDPQAMVGQKCSERFGPVLPYLLKVISASTPLSLQVHPVGFEARAGFNAQNAAHVPFDAPERSFKDAVAKSEMVVALESFGASVGFASQAFMLANLTLVDHPVARRMVQALTRSSARGGFGALAMHTAGHSADDLTDDFAEADAAMPVAAQVWPASRKRIFRAFFTAVSADASAGAGLETALTAAASQVSDDRSALAFAHALEATRAFADDASVLALLMMNPVVLDEGEAVFIPAGTPHAYIHGTAAEIMTNSDNVLRAGMTLKHKDIPNLLRSLDCRPGAPIDPSVNGLSSMLGDRVIYRPHISEFMLTYGHVGASSRLWPMVDRLLRRGKGRLAEGRVLQWRHGPRIVVCTQGAVRCTSAMDTRVLSQGQAVFVAAGEGRLDVDAVSDLATGEGSYLLASTQL